MAMTMIGDLISGLVNWGINANREEKNQNFIAAENEKNRQFAAEQAAADRWENYKYGEQAAGNADTRSRSLYNDLQSPKAILEQYKQAGLSPSLMFGGSGASGQSVPTGAQGSGANGISTPYTYSNITPTEASQMALAQAQARNLDAHTEEILGLTNKSITEIKKLLAEKGHHEAATKVAEAEAAGKQIDNYIKNATADFSINKAAEEAEIYATKAQAAVYELISISNKAKFDETTFKNRVEQVTAELDNTWSQTLLNKANAKLSDKERERINAEINKWQTEIQQGWKDLSIKLMNAENQEDYNNIVHEWYKAQDEILKQRVQIENKELRHTIINDHIGNFFEGVQKCINLIDAIVPL